MVDPVSNEGISKVAQQAGLDEAGKGSEATSSDGPDSASFQDVLEGKMEAGKADQAEAAKQAEQVEGAEEVRKSERAEMHDVDGVRDGAERVKLEKFMKSVSGDKAEIDHMMERVSNGANLDQKELLEMQALIYSYSQKVEIASKVVEKGTGGLKQMMQMRV